MDISFDPLVRNNRDKCLVALDIDETIAPNDGGDIPRIIAACTHGFTTISDRPALDKLAMLLINPRMVEAIVELRRRTTREVVIVFYSMKAKIANMMALEHPYTELTLTDQTVFFEHMPINIGFTYLSQQAYECGYDNSETYHELDRVGLLTWAMSYMLGLPYAAGGFITAGKKDINRIAEMFGFDPYRAYLFDDKAPEHIAAMDNTPYANQHIIQVPAYNFVTMPDSKSVALEHHLKRHYPIAGFDSAHPGHYDSICNDPEWPADKWCITAACEWQITKRPNVTTQPWDLSNVTFY